ncbi:MAG TPA: nucleotide exchange factor GrpE [Terrimesophilobacter sp.]|uniref:nucleotide exchange factor GrpE n=1 Tax=Terrimesophilobacter sp. TaxID=2906435 RepID=UPI002F93D7B9
MATDKDKDKKKDQTPGDEPVIRDPSTLRDGREATSSGQAGSGQAKESAEPIVRDRRRIDPETGEARKDVEDVGEQLTDEDLAKLLEEPVESVKHGKTDAASEHLHDLKRVQAEYANYRKRVDRDRYVARDLAVAEVITSVLPVLDDLDLAHAHGDLEGSPLELVALKLRASFERYGLTQIGAKGEVFDPSLHEAIAQLPSKDVTVNTIAEVIQPGYQIGERLLRPAKVAVSVPEE